MQNNWKDLTFNEEYHRYTLNGVPFNSVSSEVAKFYKKFEADRIAYAMAKKQCGSDAIALNIRKQEILSEWKAIADESSKLGTSVHLFAENYVADKMLKPSNGFEESIIAFWESLPTDYQPAALELRMYIEELKLAGTLDVLIQDSNGLYHVYDYKTNKDLFNNFKGQKMLSPFSDMLDTPYSHYVLQQNYYTLMLKTAGIEVSTISLVSIRPEGYSIHAVPNITNKLIAYYDNLGINIKL